MRTSGQGLGPGFTIVAMRRSVIFSLDGRELVLTPIGYASIASAPKRVPKAAADVFKTSRRCMSSCPFRQRCNSRYTSKALENKFCAELNVTIVGRGLRYVAEQSGIPSRIRISEIRMIENVEHFRAELEFEPLLNRKILKDRKIGIHESGSDENVASRIAKSELRGQGESTRINATHKMSRAAIGARRSHDIWALIAATDVCLIGRDQDVERYPRLCRENSVSLPVAQRPSQDIRAIKGRQVVNKAGDEPVANVPVGIAIVTPP